MLLHVTSLNYDRDKMYKRRIKQWGLDKNKKDKEMRAIVRKTNARVDEGKRSKIHVRGKAIGDEEVIRYWSRKRISIDDVITHRAASVTPEAVDIVTPVPSRVATPASLAVPERIFIAIRDYFEGSFASGNWVNDSPEIACRTRKVQGDPSRDLIDLTNNSLTACQLFSRRAYEEVSRIMVCLTSKFKEILLAELPETLGHIFDTVVSLRLEGRNEIGMAILRHFFALGELVVGKEHPLRLICGWLASADVFQFDEILARCVQSLADQFESFVGPMHYSTLVSRMCQINNEELLQNLLGRCELHLGYSDVRTNIVRYELTGYYFNGGQYAEALRLGQDLIANVQYGQPSVPDLAKTHYYTFGLSVVAHSQWALGQKSLAESNLRKAIALRSLEWGVRDSRAGYWLLRLEHWLMDMGRWSCAAEVREKRMSMLDPAEVL